MLGGVEVEKRMGRAASFLGGRSRGRFLLPVLLVGLFSCGADAAAPESPDSGGVDHGVNGGMLGQAYAQARQTPGILSLLVQKDGVLVGEEYFHGSTADSLNQVWSVTKSVVSILTGIAIQQGALTGLDQTLDEFLPTLIDSLPADKGRITLGQLITMTSGLQWHELDGGNEYSRWAAADDMIQYVVDRPWAYPPGERFLYNTGGTHLLAVVLAEATGTPVLDYAREHLFGPLGIERAEWWTDERGYYTGGMGLWLRPRDMVKIGELFLREGMVGATQVVPKEWVQESTASHVSTGNASPYGPGYGYSWWVGHAQGRDFYFANGYAGQFILVCPELKLVVVATSGWRGLDWNSGGTQWSGVMDVIVNRVLPAVRP